MRSRLALRLAGMTNCEATSARVGRWPDRRNSLRDFSYAALAKSYELAEISGSKPGHDKN